MRLLEAERTQKKKGRAARRHRDTGKHDGWHVTEDRLTEMG